MKKHILILLLLLFSSSLAYCQFDKGSWMLGATGTGSYFKREGSDSLAPREYPTISLNPQFGHFFLNRFALGLSTPRGIRQVNKSTSSEIGIGPFARYYFYTKNKTGIFGHIQYTYVEETSKNYSNTRKNKYKILNAGVGIDYLITEHVAVEALLYYQKVNEFMYIRKGIRFDLGFQIFIPSAAKE